MDNERYARYLSGGSSDFNRGSGQGSQHDSELNSKASTGSKASFDFAGVKTALMDAKAKLGLQGLSNMAALLLALFICVLCGLAVWSYSPSLQGLFSVAGQNESSALIAAGDDESSLGLASDVQDDPVSDAINPNGTIYVYISGAVYQPDVYELELGARAIDVLNAAGGFLDSAASEAVNLAAELSDGSQIHILTKEEFEEQGGGLAAIITQNPTSPVAGESGTGDGLVNLNTADSTALQTLPGIGPVTADKIVKDRETNGPYSSLEDLTRVSGIGPKRVEGLDGIASVGP